MKTLAICIPTYKRPEMLKRCVESAFASADGKSIKVFISDDSISDVNLDVLGELTEKFDGIQWHRNEVNLGIDLNIQRVLAMSDCDYCWIIGEDDRFLPSAVANMFEIIQHQSHPFIFSNYQYVDETHTKVLGTPLNNLVDGECNVDIFIKESLWSVGFIGCCVIQRQSWQQHTGDIYNGTYFTHVGRILDMLTSQQSLYISALAAVSNRAQGEDTFTWKKDSFGVFLGFERMCRIAAERNPSLSIPIQLAAKNYRLNFAYLSIKTTFRLRSEGAFDLRQYQEYISQLDIEIWRKVWLFFLAITPRLIVKPLASSYYIFRHICDRWKLRLL
jgi:glycosyltransferase involved in cell wall biosynthesis